MIDKNRPQIRRTTPQGVTVIEFHDQRGEYFDVRGDPVGEAQARSAGYDVEAGKRARRKRELEEQAQKRVDKQIAQEFGSIPDELAREFDTGSAAGAGSLSLKEGPRGKWSVIEDDGRVLVDGLSKKEAEESLADLSGRGEAAPV